MNLVDPRHADHIRARRAAGDAVIGLVVSADGEPPYDPPLGYRPGDWAEPPAEWVALTGSCETCGGDHRRGRHLIGTWSIPHWEPCHDCIDGRKRATLTVACHCDECYEPTTKTPGRPRPLAVATVEVVPVLAANDDVSAPGGCRRFVIAYPGGRCFLFDADGRSHDITLDRTPTPGVDFVVLLTDVDA